MPIAYGNQEDQYDPRKIRPLIQPKGMGMAPAPEMAETMPHLPEKPIVPGMVGVTQDQMQPPPVDSPAAPAPQKIKPLIDPNVQADSDELTRLTTHKMTPLANNPSEERDQSTAGYQQIQNPFLRGLASVGNGLLSTALPRLAPYIPGTSAHHNQLVGQAEKNVSRDQDAAKNAADVAKETANANFTQQQVETLAAEGKQKPKDKFLTAGGNIFNAETGKWEALPTDRTDLYDIGAEHGQQLGIPADAQGRYLLPKNAVGSLLKPEKEKGPTYHTVNGSIIALTPGPDGKPISQVVYHGDPDAEVVDLDVGGKPHKVIVNKRTGARIQDLGQSGIKPPTVNVNAQQHRGDASYDKRNAELVSIGKPIDDLSQRFGRLEDTLNSGTPQADALVAPELLTVMAGGAGSGLRMNETEIQRIVGGRSNWEGLKAAINKWSIDPKSANSITPEQRRQIRELTSVVGQKLQKKTAIINEAHRQITDSDDPNQHRRIVNDTREKLHSIDGGSAASPQQEDLPGGVTMDDINAELARRKGKK